MRPSDCVVFLVAKGVVSLAYGAEGMASLANGAEGEVSLDHWAEVVVSLVPGTEGAEGVLSLVAGGVLSMLAAGAGACFQWWPAQRWHSSWWPEGVLFPVANVTEGFTKPWGSARPMSWRACSLWWRMAHYLL